MRSIFEINNLNLTEFARSFALYKNLMSVGLPAYGKKEDSKKKMLSKRDKKDGSSKSGPTSGATVSFDDGQLYSKRLKKSQQKGLEKKLGSISDDA